MRHSLICALAAPVAIVGAAVPGIAQTVTSAAPDAVAVTIYRAPDRDPDESMDLDWLEGYALVSERRTIAIPAGRSVIRFEGVAAGMLPESAIVTGLPAGVREKNLDADLLSPRSLYARSFGRPVTIRRSRDGTVIEEPGIIRSGPSGAAILQTRAGFEAIDCGPTDDSIVYDSIPEGLSAKPTLAVQIDSPRAGTVTVTLSYLAWGFDWQANYVATLSEDGAYADLTGWVTLASSDSTSFPQAETMVVAGEVNREDSAPYPDEGDPYIEFECFASGVPQPGYVPAPPPPPPPPLAMPAPAQEVVVTAQRREADTFMVSQEELGDLKLYRVPIPTTVAAMAQKQVALLTRENVKADLIYRFSGSLTEGADAEIVLRMRNREDAGLGLPLPAGNVAVFAPQGERTLLIGEDSIGDTAVDEKVEVSFARATQVHARLVPDPRAADRPDDVPAGADVFLTNALPHPVSAEVMLGSTGYWDVSKRSGPGRIIRRDGSYVWTGEVPANGSVRFGFRQKRR